MKTISMEYYGFTGKGRTVKEAKSEASRQMQSFIKDAEGGPTIVMVDTIAVVFSRIKHSWQYQLIGGEFTPQCAHSGYESKKEAERRARMHVVQSVCIIPGNPRLDLITDEEDKKDHLRWFDWQLRYKEAKARGCSDEDAREAAALQ
ncbi:MAG: hypothetical protein ACHQ0Y_04990 [Thermodesulfovibrionales bacterium]